MIFDQIMKPADEQKADCAITLQDFITSYMIAHSKRFGRCEFGALVHAANAGRADEVARLVAIVNAEPAA
jgi:hypothetical protein